MMSRRLRPLSSTALALALCISPVAAHESEPAAVAEKADNPLPLALMGTIPVYWGEVESGFDALITGELHPHWARAQLERNFSLWPLDYLTPEALGRYDYLLMAQPRGLAPEENVALDDWVRAGGRLLLLADPMMTGHSHYPLGDRRRPQDTALLSPILAHWGLELLFDADQAEGADVRVDVGDSASIPVNRAGRFGMRNSNAACSLKAAEILAFCSIGEGQAVILADAALLDLEDPPQGSSAALEALSAIAFAHRRVDAGNHTTSHAGHEQVSENTRVSYLAKLREGPPLRELEPPPDP